MLGRVLTEEEDRQRRDRQQAAAPTDQATTAAVPSNGHDAINQQQQNVHHHVGSTSNVAYGAISHDNSTYNQYNNVQEHSNNNQSDSEEYDASYNEEEESENDLSSSAVSDDDGDDDDDEDSYLLHDTRRKRKRKNNQTSSSLQWWKRSLGKITKRFATKIRAAAIAIADVDNVWDSPENSLASSSNSLTNNRSNCGRVAGGITSRGGIRGGTNNAPSAHHHNNGRNRNNSRASMVYDVITGGTSTIRNRTAALFWFMVLSISYASERSTFKVMVDRVGPFRLFSAEIILGLHVLFSCICMLFWNLLVRKTDKDVIFGASSYGDGFGLGLPLADVGLMAVLDTVYLLVGVISGAHVPPVLTVILVQTMIPLTACFTQCFHPDGRCSRYFSPNEGNDSTYSVNDASSHYQTDEASTAFESRSTHTRSTHTNIRILGSHSNLHSLNESSYPDLSAIPNLPQQSSMPNPVPGWGGLSKYHIIGTGLMFLAIFMGLTPALLSLDQIIITEHDAMPEKTAYNTIVFCLAAIPAAISQLYKERTMIRLRQPIDRNKLNLVLSIFQLLFAVVVSPLAYGLQGMGGGSDWTSLYPSKQISENFSDGFRCFLGTLDSDTQATGYPEEAECRFAWILVITHVISILMVGVACDKLAAATKAMYRGVSTGIMLAVVFMFVYQIRDQWCEYGPLVSFFHLTSTAVLIVGADVYHRVSLSDASFDTTYPEIGDLYEDE